MKKQFIVLGAFFSACTLAVQFLSCGPDIPFVTPPPNVVAPALWFANSTTPLADSVTPFVDKNANDTVFHLWAWQEFLALTRSDEKKAPFENLIQVDPTGIRLGDTIFLPDSTQAGTHGVLYDQKNRAIFYTIHVNKTMYDFQQEQLTVFSGIYSHFNTNAKRDQLIQDSLHTAHLDTLNFPVGSIEVKTAWILATSLPSIDGYYITPAKLVTAQDTIVVKVALIGMHITGRVENHPESIWATYEHTGLAPDYDWSKKGYPLLGDTVSHDNFLFYQKNNVIGNCLMNNNAATSPGFNNIFNIYPMGMIRSFTSDSVPNARDLSDNANVLSLNKSVLANLEKESGPWKNYFYKGAVWLNHDNSTLQPGNDTIGNLDNPSLRGARALSNLTMESYAQLDFTGNYTLGSLNCFGCHQPIDFVNVQVGDNNGISYNLALSHLFKNALLRMVPAPAAQ